MKTDQKNILYQKIAKEIGLAETAFTERINENTYKLRWFTPSFEAKLCGHATIAAAYVLCNEHDVKSPIFFHTLSGVLKADVQDEKVTLSFPTFEYDRIDDEQILEPFGIDDYIEIRFRLESPAPSFYIVLRNQEQVMKLKPDYPQLIDVSKKFGVLGIIVTAPGEAPYDYVFRQFAPRAGINEDQGTGVVHCVAAPYWGEKLGKKKMRAYQFSERGSEMEVELLDGGVMISGSAILLIKGKMHIPLPVE
jgi:PhzF family phenazine biosynthesis protein